jgi:hypothetical protein
MEKVLEIVDGGGWVVRKIVGRPKTRLFLLLSAIWLIVSVPASFPFLDGWPQSFSELEFLAILLIAPHPIFIALAIFFCRTERPCIIEEHLPNPDYDPKNLH